MPKHVHLIGVGGIGMSAVAKLLIQRGHHVSGSDSSQSPILEDLKQMGVRVYQSHRESNVDQAELVVYSSAIHDQNPEMIRAKQRQITIKHRAELLAEMMDAKTNIAIAGTHGKTTTTSLVSHIFIHAKLNPTIVIGGQTLQTRLHAQSGQQDYAIFEADESDNSFVLFNPNVAVITNIDNDHLENHGDSFQQLTQSFNQFIERIKPQGLVIANIDCPHTEKLTQQTSKRHVTFAINNPHADYIGSREESNYIRIQSNQHAPFVVPQTQPGQHNTYNTLAAVVTALEHGIDPDTIGSALSSFQGVKRRFEIHTNTIGQPIILEDYGHHPVEVECTISAIKEAWPKRKIVMVFQPHRLSRTLKLCDEFAKTLSFCDEVYITDIYHANESVEKFPISSTDLIQRMNDEHHHTHCQHISQESELFCHLDQLSSPDSVIVFQGAGNIHHMCLRYCKHLASLINQA